MYFRSQSGTNLLKITDNFAHLSHVNSEGDLVFQFSYKISQSEVIKRNATKVKVSVESRGVAKKSLLGQPQRGSINTKEIVSNLRTAVIDAKSTAEQRTQYQLASRISDVSANINNEILPQLRAGVSPSLIQSLTKPRLTVVPVQQVKQSNDPQPILHLVGLSNIVPDVSTALTASLQENPQALMQDMILRQGIDPSHVLQLTSRSVSEKSSKEGLLTTTKARESQTDPATRLLNLHLFSPSSDVPPRTTNDIVDSDLVQVMSNVTTDDVEVNVSVTIPASRLRLEGAPVTQVFVVFELMNSKTNLALDTVTKVLDLAKYVQVYYTPKEAPQLKAASSDISSRINLEIQQIDPGATEVELYKKSIWVSSPETDSYTLIGKYPLTSKDQSLLIQVDKPINSPVIYRVIPRGRQSTQGFEFSNIAVRPPRYNPVKAVSITAQQVDTGVQVEARQIPSNVIAIQFMRWNLTTFDTSASIVGGDVGFIDESTRQADMVATIDPDVTFDNIYRYSARLIYLDGHTADFGDATIEFIKPSPGEVDTKIVSVQVTHAVTPNVTFSISTTIVDTDLDAVKKMLTNQGLAAYFSTDILTQRDQLKKLIAHQVSRVDLTTGKQENFGVLTTDQFDDNALRKNQAISPLEYGHRYRYVIYPLLRQPETLFDSYRKDAVDAVTKKSYTYSPAKFQHPVTLKRGTIVSSKGVLLRQAKDPMSHGIIGSSTTTEVSFDEDSALITELSAVNFDRYQNIVSWRILGDISQVDHFLVMKQVHGIRTAIGKTHSEFVNGSCQYLHKISKNDIGAVQYVVVPIFNDYRLGTAALTNTLLVTL